MLKLVSMQTVKSKLNKSAKEQTLIPTNPFDRSNLQLVVRRDTGRGVNISTNLNFDSYK